MVQQPLNNIVREYLIESGDSNGNRFARVYQIGVSILRELNLDTAGTPTAVLIPLRNLNTPEQKQTQSQVSENAPPQNATQPNPSTVEGTDQPRTLIASLPSDFVQLIRLAAINGNGQLEALGEVGTIEFPRFHNSCGKEIQVPVSNNGTDINATGVVNGNLNGNVFWNNLDGYADFFRNAEATGRQFGAGGGNNVFGGYRIDLQRGTIILEGVPCHTPFLMLEYLSDLTLIDGQYFIHPFIIEALKTGMRYGDIRFNPRIGLGEKQIAKREYDLAEKQSRRRFNNRNLQDYLQAMRLSNKASPKF